MKIKNMKFNKFTDIENEGIVLLGAGGDQNEWIEGVTEMLFEDEIANSELPETVFDEAISLITSGGRNDLALTFNKGTLDLGKLAIWRLNFGNCSWISDYKVNYSNQHC